MSGQMGDILRQLAREYIVETAEFIEQMAKKLEFGEVDLEEIQKVAHKLKGSGATYGFDKIAEECITELKGFADQREGTIEN